MNNKGMLHIFLVTYLILAIASSVTSVLIDNTLINLILPHVSSNYKLYIVNENIFSLGNIKYIAILTIITFLIIVGFSILKNFIFYMPIVITFIETIYLSLFSGNAIFLTLPLTLKLVVIFLSIISSLISNYLVLGALLLLWSD